MEQVREAAAPLPPLSFPWPRFVLGLAMVSVLAGLSGWGIASLPVAEALSSTLGRALAVLQDPSSRRWAARSLRSRGRTCWSG
jgi:hypothetical protein